MNTSIKKADASNVFDLIKNTYTIRDIAGFCGLQLPVKGKFCSPFRPDRNPSCEVNEKLFTDWTSGEHLDAPAFFAALRGITLGEARRELMDRLGITGKTSPATFQRACKPVLKPAEKPAPKPLPELPPLYRCREFFKELAEIRSVSIEAVSLAVDNLGTIRFFHDSRWKRGWVLTDRSERVLQGRLITGEKWYHGGKTHNFIKGIHYPVGIATSWKFPADFPILLVEGSGDYLAACDVDLHAKREFLPVAMLGTLATIPDDCLPFFKGRDVRIIAHPGDGGRKAAEGWKSRLDPVARVTGTHLRDGDLNDLVKRDGAASVARGLGL